MSMGFDFEQANRALMSCNQNVEQALEMLLSGVVVPAPQIEVFHCFTFN